MHQDPALAALHMHRSGAACSPFPAQAVQTFARCDATRQNTVDARWLLHLLLLLLMLRGPAAAGSRCSCSCQGGESPRTWPSEAMTPAANFFSEAEQYLPSHRYTLCRD